MFVGGLPSELDGFRTFVTFVTFQQLWLRPIDPGSIIGDRNTGKFDLFRTWRATHFVEKRSSSLLGAFGEAQGYALPLRWRDLIFIHAVFDELLKRQRQPGSDLATVLPLLYCDAGKELMSGARED